MSDPSQQVTESLPHRTRFLSILCFLSGLYAIYGIISGLTSALAPPEVDDLFIEELFSQIGKYELPIADLKDEVEAYYLNLMLNFGNYGASNFLFFAIQLIGVALMYQLNRVGFALYIMAQLGLALTPALFGGFNTFGQISLSIALVWNALWVILFATQIKHFRR